MRNYAFAALVLVLGSYAYFGIYKKEASDKQAQTLESKLVPWELEDLKRLKIVRAENPVEVVRDDRGWIFQQPFEDRGDLSSIDNWIRTLLGAKRNKTVFEEKVVFDKATFGLTEPEAKLFFEGENSEVREFHIGQRRAFGQDLYIYDVQGETLFTAGVELQNALQKKPFELRDRRVWRTTDPIANRIQLEGTGYNWELHQNDLGKWELNVADPSDPPVSSMEVARFLSDIHNLRLLEVPVESPSPEDEKKLGLDRPFAELKLWQKGLDEPLVFRFSDQSTKSEPNLVYVTSDQLGFIGRLYSTVRETVNVAPHRFFDKSYPFTKILAADVTAAEWQTGGEKKAVESDVLDSLVEKMKELELSEYLAQPPSVKAANSIILRGAGDQTIFKMSWLSHEGQDNDASVVLEPSGWAGRVKSQDFNDLLKLLEKPKAKVEGDGRSTL